MSGEYISRTPCLLSKRGHRYAIFTRLIEEGTVPDLYKKFTM